MMGLPLGFAQPLVLLGLISLPVLWWLLRLVPPRPRLQKLGPEKLLLDILPKEETPARTPWWLTLLRLTLAALLIIAAAGPLWNPPLATSQASAPLALLIDDGWGAAATWDTRIRTAEDLIARAETDNRGVAIIPLNIGWHLDVPANVERCFHALALDERRGNFHLHRPKVLGQPRTGCLTEVWFRGVHSDIGGNGAKEVPPRGLASIALNWMFVNAQACGLQFDPALVAENKALAKAEAKMLDNFDPIETSFRKLRDGDLVHETVASREHCNNPAATCGVVSDTGELRGTFGAPAGGVRV